MKKIKYIPLILIFIFITKAFAQDQKVVVIDRNVYFTKDEVDDIIKQFEDDKKEIQKYITRNKKLREQEPEIEYEFLENDKVKQKITIPIYKDNPLEYEVEFTVIRKDKEEGWFPLKLWLGAFLINSDFEKDLKLSKFIDAKVGIKLLSLAPMNKIFIKHTGFNIAIGIKSAGATISYNFPKPFNNTNLHLFYGYQYSTPLEKSFGIGTSLNF